MTERLNQVFELLQDRLGNTNDTLKVEEPFATDNPVGVGSPLRAATLLAKSQPFALLGITLPTLSPRSVPLVAYLARRARARRIAYLILCNQRDTMVARTPKRDDEFLDVLKHYPSLLPIVPNATGPLEPPERIAFIDLCDSIIADLITLQRDGRLGMVLPDSDFFVDRLTRAVDVLKPAVKQALQTKLKMDPLFAQSLSGWAILQGIPADLNSPDFGEAVVRQAIYRLLGKIIFYQSLRRAALHLPEMNLVGLDTGQVMLRLNQCFAEAHKVDYHAVFREDIVDRLPFPAAASAELRDLVGDLNTRDFAHLPQDVVGAVFERLIPTDDRHALGQYFTPEPLVDLIVSFCVRHREDTVLDPTCGTGTFLIRAYDRLRYRLGLHDHNQLLSQLWGVDIAPFPAELATINLFRQFIGNPGNFPRIVNDDFFAVTPGSSHRFPPLKEGTATDTMVDEPIPSFDAIVGNFPYISADRIEQTVKGYRNKVNRRLAEEWLRNYPDGFVFDTKADDKHHRLARDSGLDLTAFVEKAEPTISTYADFYVSLFWHAAAFLKPGGRMGIVTSNAWLDVGYGYALQRFLLDHFKIVAILESRGEPWFEQAAVNTVATIVERCENQAERDAHSARFVKIRRPLSELIPWDMRLDAVNRWNGLDKLTRRIEAAWKASDNPMQPETHEDDEFRIRVVRQGKLREQFDSTSQTIKWGPFLRAPQVYFDLIGKWGSRLTLLGEIAPPLFGSKTRINDFFHLNEGTIRQWEIDSEFCWPMIKSPSDSNTIRINPKELELKVFVCRKSKKELRAEGKLGTLRYIEWGEQQEYTTGVQKGMKWPDGPWVKNRKPSWYALPESETHVGRLFFTQAIGDRYLQHYSPKWLVPDARLYYLDASDKADAGIVSATLNSGVVALFNELAGRVTLGDGVLELKVEDARDYLFVPDVRQFTKKEREEIESAFQPLLDRPIGSIFDEVNQADRQALDRAVLLAMGLDPKEWLPRIYDGLTTLVKERTQLGQMRGQSRKSRPKKAASRVADEVLQDVLPKGPARFPNDFLPTAVQAGEFREIALPSSPLRHKGHMFGKEELGTEDGKTLYVANKFELRYVLYAQANKHQVARLPAKPVEVSRAVAAYTHYLTDLRERLYKAYFNRTLDQSAAERFVVETWRKLDLPEIEE